MSGLLSEANRRKAGFTIVEMLVVIGIVVGLGVLVSAYILQAQEARKVVGYKDHIDQLATALERLKAENWGKSWAQLRLGTDRSVEVGGKDLHTYGLLIGEQWKPGTQAHDNLTDPGIDRLYYLHVTPSTSFGSTIRCEVGDLYVSWSFLLGSVSREQLEDTGAFAERIGFAQSSVHQGATRWLLDLCYPPV